MTIPHSVPYQPKSYVGTAHALSFAPTISQSHLPSITTKINVQHSTRRKRIKRRHSHPLTYCRSTAGTHHSLFLPANMCFPVLPSPSTSFTLFGKSAKEGLSDWYNSPDTSEAIRRDKLRMSVAHTSNHFRSREVRDATSPDRKAGRGAAPAVGS